MMQINANSSIFEFNGSDKTFCRPRKKRLQLQLQLQLLPRQRHPASSRTGRSWVWFGHGTDLGLQRHLQQVPRELSSFENPLWLWGLRFGRNILTILYILAVSSSTSMVVYLLAAVEILEILDFCVIMS
jgi:hypothetical protein